MRTEGGGFILNVCDSTISFFENVDYSDELGESLAIDAVKQNIAEDIDYRTTNKVECEYAKFLALSHGYSNALAGVQTEPIVKFTKFLFLYWISISPNSYAVAYRLGKQHMEAEHSIDSTKEATQKRIEIGKKSRIKIEIAAQQFRNVSREVAAEKLTPIINLSYGTILKHLSKIFPGTTWKI